MAVAPKEIEEILSKKPDVWDEIHPSAFRADEKDQFLIHLDRSKLCYLVLNEQLLVFGATDTALTEFHVGRELKVLQKTYLHSL